ncbi:MAG: putative two-component sensor protein [Ilumatobacteraceae bacterium]|nr:putative two-component sensor protein [Ilumatobacteraceae bacterium]
MVVLTVPNRRGWSDWTLARRLRTVLVGLSVLLVLTGVTLVVVLHQADRALSEQVQRTYPARLAASQLLASLVDQETGLRGYALTGDEQFLGPYRQGLIDEEAARAELDRLIGADDPARLSLLTVDAAITAWRDQYASLRTAGDTGTGTDASIQFGRQLFDRVRQTNADLDAQLANQLTSARDAANRDRHVVVIVLGLMAVVVVVAVVGLQRALKSSILRPMDQLAAQVRVVSRGEHGAPIRPHGPPDIREVGEGVESMRLELVGVLAEVESQRRGLERKAAELARSNADLEQFAYVASHDLQEPLRKVASFCQLLEQRYSGKLDDRADQYIAFAVDGAKRMQLLITDLLTFSRVGRTSEGFVSVDLGLTVDKAWGGLEDQARTTGAQLAVDIDERSRRVHGDASLLQMLLTNLLGNALKYRRQDLAPVVHVTATAEETAQGQMVRVDVADNGIGIPEEYAEKVFVIFQRLHGRDEYEGTGIGLALAKKVVEFHGGSIRVLPAPFGGTCVSFTLPMEESPAHA